MCNIQSKYLAACDQATSFKQSPHLVIIKSIAEVLHVNICKLLGAVAHHVNTFTTCHETTDEPNDTLQFH